MTLLTGEARELHTDCLVVDLHADTLELVSTVGWDLDREHRSWAWFGHLLGHIDLPRALRGGLTAQVFGVVIPPWTRARRALERVRAQAALLQGLAERLPEGLIRARTAGDVRRAKAEGKLAAFIGVEGSHGMRGGAGLGAELARLGATYLGPAHLFNSPAARSNWRRGRGGLGRLGWELIEDLWDHDILVDLAHMAREPFLEVCRRAARPVIVSHTGLAALKPMWRNIDDEQIRAVAATGGVIGVIFTPRYLGQPGVEGIAAHLEHLVKVGGEDVAALGSDFDGLVRPPRDLRDAAGLPLITGALLERGMPEPVIRKVLGVNALRVVEGPAP